MKTPKEPQEKELKFLGTFYAKDAWGNEDADKLIKWLHARLEEEMEKNAALEMRNFSLEIKNNLPWYKNLFR